MKTTLLYTKLILTALLVMGSFTKMNAQNCAVNSGVSKTICPGGTLELDGGTTGNIDLSTILWLIASQPAGSAITITNPYQFATTTSSATVPGNYVFTLQATCQDGVQVSQSVTHIVTSTLTTPNNLSPATSPSSCISAGSTVSFTGNNDPVGGETQDWTYSSNMFAGSFSNSSSSNPTFTYAALDPNKCLANGNITFTRTIINAAGCKSSKSVTYTNLNFQVPLDATVSTCGGISLLGTCPGNGTITWQSISPGSAVFLNTNQRSTAITNPVIGQEYTVRYTISGSSCTNGSKDLTFTYTGATATSGTIANAGPDQIFTDAIPSAITLNGNTANTALGETGVWQQLTGPAVLITNPTNAVTTVTGMPSTGTFTFRWRITGSSGCNNYDDVAIKGPLSLVVTAGINTCGSASAGANIPEIRAFRYGSFDYGAVDSVSIKVRLLSGPEILGAVKTVLNFKIIGGVGSSCAGAGCSQALDSISVGSQYNFIGIPSNSIGNTIANSLSTYNYEVAFFPKAVGDYTFGYEVTVNSNTVKTGTITIKYTRGFASNAGTDQDLACAVSSTSLVGNNMYWNNTTNPTNNLTYSTFYQGEWTTVSMPSGAVDPINPAERFQKVINLSGLTAGKYTFRLRPRNYEYQACGNEDLVDVYVHPLAAPPITMEPNKTVCNSGSTKLSVPETGYYPKGWALVSGPSAVTFSPSVQSRNVRVNNMIVGTYVFSWTDSSKCGNSVGTTEVVVSGTAQTNAQLATSCFAGIVSTVTITANRPNYAAGETATLVQYVNGVPVTWNTRKYIIESTSQNATDTSWIISGFAPTTSVSTGLVAIYTINTPGCGSTSDTFLVANSAAQVAQLNLGYDLCDVTFPYTFQPVPTELVPVAAEGMQNGPGNFEWLSQYNNSWTVEGKPAGAANPTFSAQGNPLTAVTFTSPGIYLLKSTLVEINPSLQPCLNTPTSFYIPVRIGAVPAAAAFAGNDQVNCIGSNSFSINATPASGSWVINSFTGSPAPVISNPSNSNTTVTFSSGGTAAIKWIANSSSAWCAASSFDMVNLTYTDTAIIEGPKTINLCNQNSYSFTVNKPAPNVTATFTQVGSTPSVAAITKTSSENYTISGLVNGTYIFRYTFTSANCATSTQDVELLVGSCISISGNVWNDANGNAMQNGLEPKFNYSNSLAAFLTNENGYVIDKVGIDPTGYYAFNEVISGVGYKVILAKAEMIEVGKVAFSGVLDNLMVNTGTNISGTPNVANTAGSIDFGIVTTTLTNRDFGIEKVPDSDNKLQSIPKPIAGTIPINTATNPVSGVDLEDGTLGNSQTIAITQLPLNATMKYNGSLAAVGQQISNFNPALLSYTGISGGSVSVAFNYAFLDAASKQDPSPATYTLEWVGGLPITLLNFTATSQNCSVRLNWKTGHETLFNRFEIQRSNDGGNTFVTISVIAATGNNSTYQYIDNNPAFGKNVYRLKMIDDNETYRFSSAVLVSANCYGKPVITVGPNPTKGSINITGLTGSETIRLYAVSGQLLINQKTINSVLTLDITKYSTGHYLLKIIAASQQEILSTKIIRQ